ncbi:MAG TPA: response regulator transcription factor [Candidatus Dormibacteraeota bacterium]|nr:response regulator transcription factor [Candidatus Dormibacteraeota bacterium]
MMNRIKIILADNHPIVRAGIRAELEKMENVEVVGEANDGREAVELARTLTPDLIFMDITMPILNGLEATERITKSSPKMRVVILSRHETEEYFWGALKRGASGYLLKRAAIAELEAAVNRVMGGEIYLSKAISNQLLKKFPSQQAALAKSPLEQLTERQREILQLISEGQTTKGIALILHVSPKTVEYHRAKLMERLHIHDIPGLVRFALREGMIAEE